MKTDVPPAANRWPFFLLVGGLIAASLACNFGARPATPPLSSGPTPVAALVTPTPLPPTLPPAPTVPAGPRAGHWEGQQPYVSFDVTADGQIVNFALSAPFVAATCNLTIERIAVADDAFLVDAATADPQTAAIGKFVIQGEFDDSGETATGTHRIEFCGRTLSLYPEEKPWQATWQGPSAEPVEPAAATPSTPLSPTPSVPAGPKAGHWEGQQPYVSFDVTADGQIVNFALSAPFVSTTCNLTIERIAVTDDAFLADAATADPQTAAVGKFVIQGEFDDSGETATGTHKIELCGMTLSLIPKEEPWQAAWQDPSAEPVEPAAVTPSAPATYLAELTPDSVVLGYGTYSVGRFTFSSEDPADNIHEGDPIVMHGVEYPRGIFAHAPSRLKYDLGGQSYTQFSATLGLLDKISCGDGAIFKVAQGGKELYRSEVIYPWTAPVKMQIPLTGGQDLLLSVDAGSQGDIDCDWAIWGDPSLR